MKGDIQASLSLVQSFIVMLRQVSYAINSQLKTPKVPTRDISCHSLDRWLQCTERIYYRVPLCHKDTVKDIGGFGCFELCLCGIIDLASATLWSNQCNESTAWIFLHEGSSSAQGNRGQDRGPGGAGHHQQNPAGQGVLAARPRWQDEVAQELRETPGDPAKRGLARFRCAVLGLLSYLTHHSVMLGVMEMEPKQFYPEFLKTALMKQPCERLIVSPRR